MVSLMQRRREMMQKTAGGHVPQLVRVYFADCPRVDGQMVKSGGALASYDSGGYITVPYKEGMYIHTRLGNWNSYRYAILNDGTQNYSVYLEKGSGGTSTQPVFETTLSGYSGIVYVRTNYRIANIADCYYEYYE